ncbi:MAG: hypothetical protein ACTSV5_11065 [Promethearchaeota archaeon]
MFKPKDFLDFARNILDCSALTKDESLYRSAISRSYYAAFLSAREKIDSLEPGHLSHFNVDSHNEVVNGLLLGRFYAQDLSLSDDLVELKRFRIEADYHFPTACHPRERCRVEKRNPDIPQTAENCYKMAQNIIDRVNSLK